MSDAPSVKNPALAAFFSFIVPGAGQWYCGQFLLGLGLLVATLIGYWIYILPGVLVHIGAIVGAYVKARQRSGVPPTPPSTSAQ